jgi:hypothetical protein
MGHLSARAVAHASSSYFLLTAFLKWVPHLFAFLCETVGASTSIQSQNTKRSRSVVPDLNIGHFLRKPSSCNQSANLSIQ